jgi:hypothetical protein
MKKLTEWQNQREELMVLHEEHLRQVREQIAQSKILIEKMDALLKETA